MLAGQQAFDTHDTMLVGGSNQDAGLSTNAFLFQSVFQYKLDQLIR
jgi:hypothetical protein